MNQQNLKKIKEIVEDFFEKFGFDVEIEISISENPTVSLNLTTKEPKILIGAKGQTLFEIQHILKIILRKKIEENFYLDLDINNYKKNKIQYLKELAHSIAEEVALTKQTKELMPMLPAERRIIHLELASRQDIIVQSEGEDSERRIVIKPRP